jgi:Holliday junction resolvase RusA-like endonuclease
MRPIVIVVPGDPKGQPRARAFYKKGLGVRMYDAGTAEGWKGLIALASKPFIDSGFPISGPLRVTIDFRFARPKSHYRTGKHSAELRPDAPMFHTSKPDRDNAEKAVLDCLTRIGMWRDDSQVCCGEVRKTWAIVGGATIRIEDAN